MRECQAAWRFGVSVREYRELDAGTRSPDFDSWAPDLQAVRVARRSCRPLGVDEPDPGSSFWTAMATVESVRTLIATFDAYEDEDFDRLAELYAEDVTWTGAEPGQRDCQTREDVFRMFRARMNSGGQASFDQILSVGSHVLLAGHLELDRFVSVFTVEGGRVVRVRDYGSTDEALDALKRPRM
jgi:ketosteroid isomerase-like protein